MPVRVFYGEHAHPGALEQFSGLPASIGDVPATIAGALGLDAVHKGAALFGGSPGGGRERLYYDYAEASKTMPKLKKRVRTPHGEGKVVGRLPLKGVVVVQIEDRRVEVPADEVERVNPPQ